MSRSIVARVVLGTVLVAIVTSLALAGAAAFAARILWRSSDAHNLAKETAALVTAFEVEAKEENTTLTGASQETLDESAISAVRVEVWRGREQVAARPPGAVLGPVPSSIADLAGEPPAFTRPGWRLRVQPMKEGLTLLVGVPEEAGRRALRIFALALLSTLPLCALLAAAVGRRVGRQATRPLVEFTERIARMDGVKSLERAPAASGTPVEVLNLEASFSDLMERLLGALAREREFAANASHELRTPLTAIRLRAERALADAGPQGRLEVASLIGEVDRLVRVVDSLLVLARGVESGVARGEVVNLADLARKAAERPSAANDRAEVRLPDEAMVRGDEALLGIAVENLLDNARKFSRESGQSIITLEEARGRVTLDVRTPGAMIGADERDRIFERFYRAPDARASQTGHGLGLPLARHIARLHGGELTCISAPDEDARFVLDLPAWRPEGRPEGR